MGEIRKRHTWIKLCSEWGFPEQARALNEAVPLQRPSALPFAHRSTLIQPTPNSEPSDKIFQQEIQKRMQNNKTAQNKVVVYLGLLLLTCVQYPSACKFEYSSISSWFEENLNNVRHVLFKDYEVLVVSNFDLDNHCLALWRVLDTYTVLKALPEKAESQLKDRIKELLKDLLFLQDCSFLVPETCIKHKRPLVQVLEELNSQQLESIIKVYYNCTPIRCASGSTIALTDEPVDYHDNVPTNYSTKGQHAGTVPNYEDLQQKSESSNKTALHQDFEYHTPQIARNRHSIVVFIVLFVILPVVLLVVLLTHFVLKNRLCGLCGDHNTEGEQYEVGRMSVADLEAQNGDQ